MESRRLYPDGYYAFTDGIGGTFVDGKVYYPAAIVVRVGQSVAIRILRQIVNSPLLDGDGELHELTLSFSGTIERIEDE